MERRCLNCNNVQLEPPQQGLNGKKSVLYLDIEKSTTRMTVDVFQMKQKSEWLDWHDITDPFYVICWSAGWVDDGEIRLYSGCVTGEEAIRRDDKRHLQKLWDLMNKADYVTGHNSKSADVKWLETRFLLNDMTAPQDFRHFDTLAFAKRRFKAESNALDYWARLLGCKPKLDMVRDDWLKCNEGHEPTLRKMLRYNKGDVREGIRVLKRFVAYAESSGVRVFK